MPARLVINPVVVVDGVRRPKCSTIADPGRPPYQITNDDDGTVSTVVPTYVHTSAISDGSTGQVNDWCVSLAGGVTMSGLDGDPQIVSLFEDPDQSLAGLHAWLENTPSSLGYGNQKFTRLRQRMVDNGIDTSGLDATSRLWEWVNRACQHYVAGFDIRRASTYVPGA